MTAYDREFAAEAASLDDVTAGQVAEVRRVAFDEFLAGHGYDEDGMFDVEEMELAFETGWQLAQAAITAQQPQGAPEVRTCYCGTTAPVVPGVFPHSECDGSVPAKTAVTPGQAAYEAYIRAEASQLMSPKGRELAIQGRGWDVLSPAYRSYWETAAQAAITAQQPPAPEVRHWDGAVNQATRLIDWILTGDGTARYHDGPSAIVIDVPRGVHRSGMLTAVPGDWIVRMPDGTFRVLSEDAQPAPELAGLNKRVASLYRLVDEVLSDRMVIAGVGGERTERWRQRADSA